MISKEAVNNLDAFQVSWKECKAASALIVRGWLAGLCPVCPETAGWLVLAAHQRYYLTGCAFVDSPYALLFSLAETRTLSESFENGPSIYWTIR